MSTNPTISTHVLDIALGKPAAHISVALDRIDERGLATTLTNAVTNGDGRVPDLVPGGAHLGEGRYRLRFDVAPYFAGAGRESFYSEICVDFMVGSAPEHYHVPLLLSPFGYSTYRGS